MARCKKKKHSACLLVSVLAVFGVSSPTLSNHLAGREPATPLSLPYQDANPRKRAEMVKQKRNGILYGRGPDQNITAYPSGPLGDIMWHQDAAASKIEVDKQSQLIQKDVAILMGFLKKTRGIQSLDDMAKLYHRQWNNSMRGFVDSSFFTNYKNDLFFSMERLAINPFNVHRLKPRQKLPFKVDDAIARKVSGMTTEELLTAGMLFHVDYRLLKNIPRIKGRYSAACQAYFFIHPKNGHWLPLAIKTNEGADLVYTPVDAPADWLFAKILLGQNDVWDTPWRHFASTHLVADLPYLAAQRCMSDNHPVLAIYKRFTLNGFAPRQLVQSELYARGGGVDKAFAFGGDAARDYVMLLYKKGENEFERNYFPKRLERQGLLNSKFGPPLKHFPYAEDASKIHSALKSFMSAYVKSYYHDASSIKQDQELACWFTEVKAAGSVNFPSSENMSIATLVDILTHVGYLNSVQHQAMNNNDQFINTMVPQHPVALYQPLPVKKGLSEGDILHYLPSVPQIALQLSLAAAFARPDFDGSNRALINVFSNNGFHVNLNDKSKAAVRKFQVDMEKLSAEIGSRRFGPDGLCQGAPFIWRALDPRVALFSMTI